MSKAAAVIGALGAAIGLGLWAMPTFFATASTEITEVSSVSSKVKPANSTTRMLTIMELHNSAHLENLPVHVTHDPI